MKKMAAGQFKAQCLAVMDTVHKTGESVTITKHGKPIAKVVPIREEEDDIFDYMASRVKILGDLINTTPAEDWDLG